jgi:hypothetical protein
MDGDLTSRCEYENADIPAIVIRCVQEIESRGMDEEGLYRKSGGKTQIMELASSFEQSTDFDVADPEIDIASITSLLKQYFRHLSDPLITFGVYSDFIESSKITDIEERGKAMKQVVESLPRNHRICLEFIVFHLVRVLGHEAETKVCIRPQSLIKLIVLDECMEHCHRLGSHPSSTRSYRTGIGRSQVATNVGSLSHRAGQGYI